MRKLLMVCLLTMLVLGALVIPVAAQSTSDLTALAAYLPDNAMMYAVMRSDDDFISKLDLLFGQTRELLPPGSLPPVTLSQSLDSLFATDPFNSDFQTAARSWLGDTMAFGVADLNTDTFQPTAYVLISITDKAGAVGFLESILEYQLENEFITKSESDAGTVFAPDADSYDKTAYIVTDSVLAVSSVGAEGFGVASNPLSESAAFTDSLALLPAENYDVLFYMDTAAFATLSMESMRSWDGSENPMQPLMEDFYGALGPQVYGITTLDTRSIAIDIVQRLNDTSALEDSGLVMNLDLAPVDPAFAAHVPADAPLVMQATGLGQATLYGFQNLRVMGDIIQAQMEAMPADEFYMSDEERFFREFNLGNIVTFINLSFAGMTGLNLENDVLAWMEGDYAAYLRVLPLSGDLPLTLDLALVTEAGDPAAAAQTVTAIASALEQYELEFSSEVVGDGEALALTAPLRLLLPAEARVFTTDVSELDFLVGSSGDVFAVGTRKGVTFSLSPKGGSLADSPNYVEAQAHFLDGAQAIFYIDARGLVSTIDGFLPLVDRFDRRDLTDMRALLGLFNSMSISSVYTSESASVGRFVMTLGQQPIPVIEETDGAGASGSFEPTLIPTVLPTETPAP